MRKNFIYALASVAALSLVASCNKEIAAPEVEPAQEFAGEQITISAGFPAYGFTKVEFSEYDYNDKLDLYWQDGDQITITDASDPSNTQTFTLESGAGDVTATFKGTALKPAAAYVISYDDAEAYAEQTQAADGDTGHLKFAATLSGVSDYSSFEFSQDWADANGATFTSSSVLRLRALLPDSDPDLMSGAVTAVIFKASEAIFAGSDQLKVNITDSGSGYELGILTVYANLPGEQVIAAGTKLLVSFQVSDNAYEKYTAYRELPAMTIKAGQVNSLNLNCINIDKYANANNTDIGTSSNPYLVADQNQMAKMYSEMVSKKTIYFKVVDDIDMTGIDWIPLNYESPYKNQINFDGGNHTISNLTVDTNHYDPVEETTVNHGYPSFLGVAYGTIKDVTFDKASITAGSNNAGVVAGYIGTTVDEVDLNAACSGITVSNSTVSAEAARTTRNAGMFAGVLATAGSSVVNCHVTGTNSVEQITTSYTGCSTAGFIGNVSAAATIQNCTATADVQNKGSYYTAGFIGQIGSAVKPTIENCAFLGGNITAGRSNNNSPVGGFIGRIAGGAGVSIENCYVDGAHISAPSSGRIGGFVGDAGSNATPNCFVSCHVVNSTISGAINSGGFAGTYGTASKCYVESTTITANADNVGGFVAYFENQSISDCYATATVVGGSYANIGGFIGNSRLGGNIPANAKNCFSNSTVSGSSGSVGAFIGGLTVGGSSITKCIAWNSALPFLGDDGGNDDSGITGNYTGTSGSISSQASALGWDAAIWDLSGSIPALK